MHWIIDYWNSVLASEHVGPQVKQLSMQLFANQLL